MKKLLMALLMIVVFAGVSNAGSRYYKTLYDSQPITASSSATQTQILASRFDTTNMVSCGYYIKTVGSGATIDVELMGGITESGYYPVGTSQTLWVDDMAEGTLINFPSSSQKPEVKYWFFKISEGAGHNVVVDMQLNYTKEY